MNFHDPKTWQNYDAAKQAEFRFVKLRELIPSETKSILDVGCGNGLITNRLNEQFMVTAIDTSEAALQTVECQKTQASITSIPFSDTSFDLVNCNEVLEHLNDIELKEGVRELKRVSSKHILISVPHSEQLARMYYKCAACGHREHPYGHLQSFDAKRVNCLMEPEFYLRKSLVYGPLERDFQKQLLYIKQNILNQWFSPYETCECSKCGSANFLTVQNPFTKAVNGLNRLLIKPRPYWFMALFTRKASSL